MYLRLTALLILCVSTTRSGHYYVAGESVVNYKGVINNEGVMNYDDFEEFANLNVRRVLANGDHIPYESHTSLNGETLYHTHYTHLVADSVSVPQVTSKTKTVPTNIALARQDPLQIPSYGTYEKDIYILISNSNLPYRNVVCRVRQLLLSSSISADSIFLFMRNSIYGDEKMSLSTYDDVHLSNSACDPDYYVASGSNTLTWDLIKQVIEGTYDDGFESPKIVPNKVKNTGIDDDLKSRNIFMYIAGQSGVETVQLDESENIYGFDLWNTLQSNSIKFSNARIYVDGSHWTNTFMEGEMINDKNFQLGISKSIRITTSGKSSTDNLGGKICYCPPKKSHCQSTRFGLAFTETPGVSFDEQLTSIKSLNSELSSTIATNGFGLFPDASDTTTNAQTVFDLFCDSNTNNNIGSSIASIYPNSVHYGKNDGGVAPTAGIPSNLLLSSGLSKIIRLPQDDSLCLLRNEISANFTDALRDLAWNSILLDGGSSEIPENYTNSSQLDGDHLYEYLKGKIVSFRILQFSDRAKNKYRHKKKYTNKGNTQTSVDVISDVVSKIITIPAADLQPPNDGSGGQNGVSTAQFPAYITGESLTRGHSDIHKTSFPKNANYVLNQLGVTVDSTLYTTDIRNLHPDVSMLEVIITDPVLQQQAETATNPNITVTAPILLAANFTMLPLYSRSPFAEGSIIAAAEFASSMDLSNANCNTQGSEMHLKSAYESLLQINDHSQLIQMLIDQNNYRIRFEEFFLWNSVVFLDGSTRINSAFGGIDRKSQSFGPLYTVESQPGEVDVASHSSDPFGSLFDTTKTLADNIDTHQTISCATSGGLNKHCNHVVNRIHTEQQKKCFKKIMSETMKRLGNRGIVLKHWTLHVANICNTPYMFSTTIIPETITNAYKWVPPGLSSSDNIGMPIPSTLDTNEKRLINHINNTFWRFYPLEKEKKKSYRDETFYLSCAGLFFIVSCYFALVACDRKASPTYTGPISDAERAKLATQTLLKQGEARKTIAT